MIVRSNHYFDIGWTREFGRMNLRTVESIEFLRNANLKTATVTSVAGKFFISVTYEKTNQKARAKGEGTIGLDLGIKHAVASYDGLTEKIFDLPESIKKAERLQENHQRKLSKKVYNSNNYWKQARLVAKQYARQANIRKDFLDKLTT